MKRIKWMLTLSIVGVGVAGAGRMEEGKTPPGPTQPPAGSEVYP